MEQPIVSAPALLPQAAMPLSLALPAEALLSKWYGEALTPAGVSWVDHLLQMTQRLQTFCREPAVLNAALIYHALSEAYPPAERTERQAESEQVLDAAVGELVLAVNAFNRVLQRTRDRIAPTERAHAEMVKRLILASVRDLRVILILLVDHAQTLHELAAAVPARGPVPIRAEGPDTVAATAARPFSTLAMETLAVFAPLTHQLGIDTLKNEMEDCAFRILQPDLHQKLQQSLHELMESGVLQLEVIKTQLETLLGTHHIPAHVQGRTKHLYSIHNKIEKRGVPLAHIHDLLATRIITDSVENCYRALGVIHGAFTPLPGRFKDYIALPKRNGYQSLHTTVLSSELGRFEVQIRTAQMNSVAELGLAAHYYYKAEMEDGQSTRKTDSASMSSPHERTFVRWSREMLDSMNSNQRELENIFE